jgi:hypothetical protein
MYSVGQATPAQEGMRPGSSKTSTFMLSGNVFTKKVPNEKDQSFKGTAQPDKNRLKSAWIGLNFFQKNVIWS